MDLLKVNQVYNSKNTGSFPEIDYDLVDVKFTPLYDLYLKELMTVWEFDDDLEFLKQTWEQTNAEAWHADAVYELYVGGKPSGVPEYVVCWGNRIVRIRFLYWKPDITHIKVIVDLLSV